MMKQIYTIFLLTFFLISAQAQERSFDASPVLIKSTTSFKAQKDASRSVIDTTEVFFPTWNDDCSNSLTNFEPTGAWGRVSGMNEFLDLAKAQRLEFISDAYRILGGICYFAQASVVGDGEFQMNFYQVDETTGGPGTMLASTLPRNVSDIILPDSFIQPTIFVVPPDMQPSLTASNFFAGVEFGGLYETQDSIAVFQTDQDCGDGTNTWELQGSPDTLWNNVVDSWGLNADFAITAIVEFDELADAHDFIKSKGITLYPAFPNPAEKKHYDFV